MTCDLALLEADLRRDEGVRRSPYKDTLGNWTIAVGHLIQPNELGLYQGEPLSDQEIDRLLMADIKATTDFLDADLAWWVNLPEPAGRAIANQAFQLRHKLLGFHAMLTCLQGEDWEGAAAEALASRWASQTPERAKRIAELYRSCILAS